MTTWKILITDGLADNGQKILRAAGDVADRSGITADELLAEVGDYHALVVRGRTKVTAQVFEAASKLKVIGRAGVGVDNIDLAAAQSRQIVVVNTPNATTTAVAEHTLGLMLALVRRIPHADDAMKSGQWLKKELKGIELWGKTLGILGLGRIGSGVAQRAAAFGMLVLGYDPFVDDGQIRSRGAEPVTPNELYTRADFISLHLPLNPKTRGMIDGQAIASMKRGVYLICAARGGVIDEVALHGSLESGQVGGAALDVFAKEPPGLTALVAHPNLIATPHIGAQTVEAQARSSEDVANQVLGALRNEPLSSRIV
ncbi:MAG: hydroxyacid dehydrogenase [Chloroflexi bacterium]|nr:hydroxyacid dehydrogenase [Chloroflexota bacterium]